MTLEQIIAIGKTYESLSPQTKARLACYMEDGHLPDAAYAARIERFFDVLESICRDSNATVAEITEARFALELVRTAHQKEIPHA